MKYIEIMNARSSVRSYSEAAVDSVLKDRIRSILSEPRKGPFGTEHRLTLIDTTDDQIEELGKLSSYGLIRGARLYFGGYSDSDDKSVIDYGYCFQQALIELTALELGTCWLGGTFNRSFIAKALSMPEGKIIPAISPVGISLNKRHFGDRLARIIAKSDRRKAPETLFFTNNGEAGMSPLKTTGADEQLLQVLNAVRFAPSASNKQPWRLICDSRTIHLYWDFDERYNRTIRTFNIQALDMGIALYHIRKSAEEMNWKGDFTFSDPGLTETGWRYIASWT